MAYFNKEQIEKAREIDLISYLQTNNPDELVYDSRGTYRTKTHDSLKISNGLWYWFSRGVGGKSALDYLIIVENMSFTEAVSLILGTKGLEKKQITISKLSEDEKRERLILPTKSKNNSKVIEYLASRGISKNIIDECINKDLIYQDDKNNVVFVGYDCENYPRYAGVRATNSSRFMHDVTGSDKAYSFRLTSINSNNSLHIFESAIDLLSYATLRELSNKCWDEENLLSLAGVYNTGNDISDSKLPKTITSFLRENQNIKKIYLHFDNDKAGRLATGSVIKNLSDRYEIIDFPPQFGKDFNDYLCEIIKNRSKNIKEKVR